MNGKRLFQPIFRLLFHDFGLKLLALALAVIIYFTLRSGTRDNSAGHLKGPYLNAELQTQK